MNVGPLVRRGAEVLARAGVADPLGDARRLMAHALGVPPDRLLLHEREVVPPGVEDAFARHVEARARRQPVSQIVGSRLFWGRAFAVTPDVLDPRPETETLVAEALAAEFARVVDLGTGSGCLLVTLLAERGGATGHGLDLSPAALDVAQANARRHGVADRAAWAVSDWWAAAGGPFDLAVSNPPYVALHEMPGLAPEVRDWEPRAALTDEGDGLGAYRVILAGAGARLAPGGRLLVEVGAGQAEAVRALGRAAGLRDEGSRADLDGRPRVCAFRRG